MCFDEFLVTLSVSRLDLRRKGILGCLLHTVGSINVLLLLLLHIAVLETRRWT